MDGKINKNISWNLNEGELTLSGSGEISWDNVSFLHIYQRDNWNFVRNHTHTLIVEEGIVNIGRDLFERFGQLKSVSLPNSLKYIGERAFQRTKALQSLDLPESLERIKEGAFSGSGLIRIRIPGAVRSIEKEAFRDCEQLETVQLYDGVENLYAEAFCGCVKLRDVMLTDSIICIDARCFGYCDALETIRLPRKLISLGREVLIGCEKLRELVLPDALTHIPEEAFSGCKGLVTVVFPQNCCWVAAKAFFACTSLKQVVNMPEPAYMDPEAFQNCPLEEAKAVKAFTGPRIRIPEWESFNGNPVTEEKKRILAGLPFREQLAYFRLAIRREADRSIELREIREEELSEYMVRDGIIVGLTFLQEICPGNRTIKCENSWLDYEKTVSGKEWSDGWYPTYSVKSKISLKFVGKRV